MSDIKEMLQEAAAQVVETPPSPVHDEAEKSETLDEMLTRHREEQRALQTRIIGLRKSTPKSDKRKKREMNSKIADLEYELKTKHDRELNELNGIKDDDGHIDDGISLETLNRLSVEEEPVAPQPTPATSQTTAKKPNRQKLRKERKEAEMQRLRDEAEQEAEGQVDMAAVEKSAIEELLVPMRLQVKQITADGHCLYNAFSDQLLRRYKQANSYTELRKIAADYMREHPDDFMPFLYKDNGDMYTKEDFDRYCDDVENTAVWGGELEILALSRAKQVPVHIVQMGSPVLKINEEEYPDKVPLKLAYHKHLYTLGAHYNSLADA
ncbi:uncharacterized protein BYT42DRAFT_582617 [Radiomyces spectabilis]|uniref:uncharacterized protein n=1 Tax=Radiomyces spectabilis TaxID=64574 RepID=UPI00221E3999|nr:uncharacterized protein BYT42DRAFT_582617 [Radiomyces spectabilis]KAI8370497.1 hypothetical protein BYT42DRAFT_582617 [Radiomyces spectabilis]